MLYFILMFLFGVVSGLDQDSHVFRKQLKDTLNDIEERLSKLEHKWPIPGPPGQCECYDDKHIALLRSMLTGLLIRSDEPGVIRFPNEKNILKE
jgi:flagellar biosynthesis regulator FlbT